MEMALPSVLWHCRVGERYLACEKLVQFITKGSVVEHLEQENGGFT